MAIHPQDIIEQLMLSFKGSSDKLTNLKSSLMICLQAVKILESQIQKVDEETLILEEYQNKQPKEEDLSGKEVTLLSADVLVTVCEFLNNNQVVTFRQLNKSLFVGLMGCPLTVNVEGRYPMKYLNQLSKLRINHLASSPRSPICDCIASRFVRFMSREFPEQMALCPLEYSRVSSKYQFSPSISELKSLGYYQPWTISEISLTKSMSSQNIDRIIEMKHILRLKSLTIQSTLPFGLLGNFKKPHSLSHQNNDFSNGSIVSNLRRLVLSSTASFHIETLTSLVQIEELCFDNCNNIEANIEVLSSLHHLKRFFLKSSPNIQGNISSLTCLGQLNELTIVDSKYIHGNLFSFSNLIKLKKLRLVECNNIVGDLFYLSGMIYLSSLTIDGMNGITGDVQHLNPMINLTELIALGLHISGDLSSLSALKRLRLISCVATDVLGNTSSMSLLTKTEKLHLGRSDMSGDIICLDHMMQLKSLGLNHSNVKGDIEALSNLTNLESLSLDETNVKGDIEALRNMTNLELLSLNETNVKGDIEALSDLTKLELLHLCRTNIKGDIKALRNLTHLESVDLGTTSLFGHIEVFASFDGLRSLDLSNSGVYGPARSLFHVSFLNLEHTLVDNSLFDDDDDDEDDEGPDILSFQDLL